MAHDSLTIEDARKMTVAALKEALKQRGAEFGPKDRKADLLNNLIGVLSAAEATESQEAAGLENKTEENTEKAIADDDSSDSKHVQEVSAEVSQLPAKQTSTLVHQPMDIECTGPESGRLTANTESHMNPTLALEPEPEPEILRTATASPELNALPAQPNDTKAPITTIAVDTSVDTTRASPEDETQDGDKETTPHMEPRKDVSPTSETIQPFHIRIDNFQRPLNAKSLLAFLEEQSGSKIPLENLWVNAIKTHCYVTFPSEAYATACIRKVTGLRFPSTSSLVLEASMTKVSAQEAQNSKEAQMKPGEWKNVKVGTSSSSSVIGGHSGSGIQDRLGGKAGGILGRLGTANGAAAGHTFLGSLKRGKDGDNDDLANVPNKRARNDFDEDDDMNVNDIFKKTNNVRPNLYWIPVDEQEVQRRRKLVIEYDKKHSETAASTTDQQTLKGIFNVIRLDVNVVNKPSRGASYRVDNGRRGMQSKSAGEQRAPYNRRNNYPNGPPRRGDDGNRYKDTRQSGELYEKRYSGSRDVGGGGICDDQGYQRHHGGGTRHDHRRGGGRHEDGRRRGPPIGSR
jgi:hypothetical protein